MPSFFGKKKTSTPAAADTADNTPPPESPNANGTSTPPLSETASASSTKKSKGYLVRERENKRPKSPRSSKSFGSISGSGSRASRRGSDQYEHPLNLPPEERELHRLSALSAMSSPVQENGDLFSDAMEEATVNGEQNGSNGAPTPPAHQSPPPPEPELPKVDPEACKAAGNKLYKAGQYDKAIDEYTKGWSCQAYNRFKV